MQQALRQHRTLINLGLFILISLGLLILLPSRVEASDPVKAEMYMGDYEIRREKTQTGSIVNKEIKYIETGSGKIIKERTSEANTWKMSYYHTNHQGSTSLVSNNQGKVDTEYGKGRLRYFPYGEQITSHNINTQVVADTYTGQKRDTETDLMFYNARLYNQKTGLFMQADSVNDGLNRYMYVGGSPVNGIDPSGKVACELVGECGDISYVREPRRTRRPPTGFDRSRRILDTYQDVARGVKNFRENYDPYIPDGIGLYSIVEYFINNNLSSINFEGGDVEVANAWTNYLSMIIDPSNNVYMPGNPSVQYFSNEGYDAEGAIQDEVFTRRIPMGNYTRFDLIHYATYVLRNVFNVDARQVQWTTLGEGDYMVVFSDNSEISSNVYYMDQGQFGSMSLTSFIMNYSSSNEDLLDPNNNGLFRTPGEYYYVNPVARYVRDSSGNFVIKPDHRLYNAHITEDDLQEWWDFQNGLLDTRHE